MGVWVKRAFAVPGPRGLEVLRRSLAEGRFEHERDAERHVTARLHAQGYLRRDRKLAGLWFPTPLAARMLEWLDAETARAVADAEEKHMPGSLDRACLALFRSGISTPEIQAKLGLRSEAEAYNRLARARDAERGLTHADTWRCANAEKIQNLTGGLQ